MDVIVVGEKMLPRKWDFIKIYHRNTQNAHVGTHGHILISQKNVEEVIREIGSIYLA